MKQIEDCKTDTIKVTHIQIYGLDNSLRVAGFPKSIDTESIEDGYKKFHTTLGHADSGSGHDCFLKGITVNFDLDIPQYMWLQAERYHFFDIVSSQSKMHMILKMDIEKQCNKDVLPQTIEIMKILKSLYNKFENEEDKEEMFRKIIANCPMGLMLNAGVTTNYLQLKTIYKQRKNHKLKEWRDFCNMIEKLPLFKELIL